ncbi:glucosamine-6-phosphate deaminase [Paenibacillus spongiae]|uniref:Glucosamine-6-phosphate deaminase n=1 Tax=Paenibacillus spongiae TaxID=2909671 RepID=A0ABY5S3E0_9BACL|nr:glucosamine-6-phosphate deaminase [Paenibacillus spongiae]UVI28412.1 glucosamine-6-phosphate deaminase [Paenibacillus spongiae]
MKIIVRPLDQIAALVADDVQALLASKPDAVLGMTTGTTPLTTGIFQELICREAQGQLSFASTAFINPDEQIGIGPDHEQSYYQYMKRHMLDELRTQPKEWHIPIGTAADPIAECEAIEAAIARLGGVDWQLLGIGINGHICFIEPAPSLPAKCFVTPIAEVNRELYAKDYGSLADVPTHAITYGWGTVLAARELCLVACGQHKADIVARALTGNVTPELPATIVQIHPNATIILDPEAASKLDMELLRS